MKYLGIDLGTANTYIYGYDGFATPAPVILSGSSDTHGSISTVVMYENGRPALAGNIAEAEYFSQPGLRAKRRLAAQFKPEIATGSAEALAATTDFLALLRKSFPEGTLAGCEAITVGMPALAREDFRVNMRACFQKAGWPCPEFCRESDAALVSCLQAGSLHMEDIDRKSLILDFGGGTCDYTSLEKLDALQSGGDVLYGGRLFDDLFYQAFCRANPGLGESLAKSPYAWHARWLECRAQKEKFSDFIASEREGAITLRITWHDAKAARHEAYLLDYNLERFLLDAEAYAASAELLSLLAPYAMRGGLSSLARDLLAGRTVGLITWLRQILESVQARREVAKVVLTGGSSRWFFARDLAREIFNAARVVKSQRGYEDIAFGLALFPFLRDSQKRASALLGERAGDFSGRMVRKAAELVKRYAAKVAAMCGERIVSRDIMPVLEAASKGGWTAAKLEADFRTNIQADRDLLEIARANSHELRIRVQEEINFAFRAWLGENGVPLAPAFDFSAGAIGEDFFNGVSVKISRLDALNLMNFTLQNILPFIAGVSTAGVIAHSGEPVSTVVGGGAVFGATWLLARAAPSFLANRKLPAFILNESNRKKIAEKNRRHIEEILLAAFTDSLASLGPEIERRINESLKATLAGLTALNQAKVS